MSRNNQYNPQPNNFEDYNDYNSDTIPQPTPYKQLNQSNRQGQNIAHTNPNNQSDQQYRAYIPPNAQNLSGGQPSSSLSSSLPQHQPHGNDGNHQNNQNNQNHRNQKENRHQQQQPQQQGQRNNQQEDFFDYYNQQNNYQPPLYGDNASNLVSTADTKPFTQKGSNNNNNNNQNISHPRHQNQNSTQNNTSQTNTHTQHNTTTLLSHMQGMNTTNNNKNKSNINNNQNNHHQSNNQHNDNHNNQHNYQSGDNNNNNNHKTSQTNQNNNQNQSKFHNNNNQDNQNDEQNQHTLLPRAGGVGKSQYQPLQYDQYEQQDQEQRSPEDQHQPRPQNTQKDKNFNPSSSHTQQHTRHTRNNSMYNNNLDITHTSQLNDHNYTHFDALTPDFGPKVVKKGFLNRQKTQDIISEILAIQQNVTLLNDSLVKSHHDTTTTTANPNNRNNQINHMKNLSQQHHQQHNQRQNEQDPNSTITNFDPHNLTLSNLTQYSAISPTTQQPFSTQRDLRQQLLPTTTRAVDDSSKILPQPPNLPQIPQPPQFLQQSQHRQQHFDQNQTLTTNNNDTYQQNNRDNNMNQQNNNHRRHHNVNATTQTFLHNNNSLYHQQQQGQQQQKFNSTNNQIYTNLQPSSSSSSSSSSSPTLRPHPSLLSILTTSLNKDLLASTLPTTIGANTTTNISPYTNTPSAHPNQTTFFNSISPNTTPLNTTMNSLYSPSIQPNHHQTISTTTTTTTPLSQQLLSTSTLHSTAPQLQLQHHQQQQSQPFPISTITNTPISPLSSILSLPLDQQNAILRQTDRETLLELFSIYQAALQSNQNIFLDTTKSLERIQSTQTELDSKVKRYRIHIDDRDKYIIKLESKLIEFQCQISKNEEEIEKLTEFHQNSTILLQTDGLKQKQHHLDLERCNIILKNDIKQRDVLISGFQNEIEMRDEMILNLKNNLEEEKKRFQNDVDRAKNVTSALETQLKTQFQSDLEIIRGLKDDIEGKNDIIRGFNGHIGELAQTITNQQRLIEGYKTDEENYKNNEKNLNTQIIGLQRKIQSGNRNGSFNGITSFSTDNSHNNPLNNHTLHLNLPPFSILPVLSISPIQYNNLQHNNNLQQQHSSFKKHQTHLSNFYQIFSHHQLNQQESGQELGHRDDENDGGVHSDNTGESRYNILVAYLTQLESIFLSMLSHPTIMTLMMGNPSPNGQISSSFSNTSSIDGIDGIKSLLSPSNMNNMTTSPSHQQQSSSFQNLPPQNQHHNEHQSHHESNHFQSRLQTLLIDQSSHHIQQPSLHNSTSQSPIESLTSRLYTFSSLYTDVLTAFIEHDGQLTETKKIISESKIQEKTQQSIITQYSAQSRAVHSLIYILYTFLRQGQAIMTIDSQEGIDSGIGSISQPQGPYQPHNTIQSLPTSDNIINSAQFLSLPPLPPAPQSIINNHTPRLFNPSEPLSHQLKRILATVYNQTHYKSTISSLQTGYGSSNGAYNNQIMGQRNDSQTTQTAPYIDNLVRITNDTTSKSLYDIIYGLLRLAEINQDPLSGGKYGHIGGDKFNLDSTFSFQPHQPLPQAPQQQQHSLEQTPIPSPYATLPHYPVSVLSSPITSQQQQQQQQQQQLGTQSQNQSQNQSQDQSQNQQNSQPLSQPPQTSQTLSSTPPNDKTTATINALSQQIADLQAYIKHKDELDEQKRQADLERREQDAIQKQENELKRLFDLQKARDLEEQHQREEEEEEERRKKKQQQEYDDRRRKEEQDEKEFLRKQFEDTQRRQEEHEKAEKRRNEYEEVRRKEQEAEQREAENRQKQLEKQPKDLNDTENRQKQSEKLQKEQLIISTIKTPIHNIPMSTPSQDNFNTSLNTTSTAVTNQTFLSLSRLDPVSLQARSAQQLNRLKALREGINKTYETNELIVNSLTPESIEDMIAADLANMRLQKNEGKQQQQQQQQQQKLVTLENNGATLLTVLTSQNQINSDNTNQNQNSRPNNKSQNTSENNSQNTRTNNNRYNIQSNYHDQTSQSATAVSPISSTTATNAPTVSHRSAIPASAPNETSSGFLSSQHGPQKQSHQHTISPQSQQQQSQQHTNSSQYIITPNPPHNTTARQEHQSPPLQNQTQSTMSIRGGGSRRNTQLAMPPAPPPPPPLPSNHFDQPQQIERDSTPQLLHQQQFHPQHHQQQQQHRSQQRQYNSGDDDDDVYDESGDNDQLDLSFAFNNMGGFNQQRLEPNNNHHQSSSSTANRF